MKASMGFSRDGHASVFAMITLLAVSTVHSPGPDDAQDWVRSDPGFWHDWDQKHEL